MRSFTNGSTLVDKSALHVDILTATSSKLAFIENLPKLAFFLYKPKLVTLNKTVLLLHSTCHRKIRPSMPIVHFQTKASLVTNLIFYKDADCAFSNKGIFVFMRFNISLNLWWSSSTIKATTFMAWFRNPKNDSLTPNSSRSLAIICSHVGTTNVSIAFKALP
ncbi:hypothetical protein FF38_00994 [Lucilia cuprina]|uniref:Uncharacterized protein n=1 Tax=Lucilia cuprina TaxID=7375 RepID=A0A0L0BXM6_LUCCU|nr:hypothetical protein FF38_00994 [Lucilia cuprina]